MENKRKKQDKSVEEVHSKLTDLYMKCILPHCDEKVLEDFPDYLNGSPEELTFAYQQKCLKQEKKPKSKKKEVKTEVPQKKVKFFTALEMQKCNSNEKVIASLNSDSLNYSIGSSSSSYKLNGKKSSFPKKVRKVVETLSDSSSDEEDALQVPNFQPKKYPVIILKNCDGLIKKMSKSKLPAVFKSKPKISTKTKPQSSKILKDSNTTSDFDESMKKFSDKMKELSKIVPPKIIPAPQRDPSVKVRKEHKNTSKEFEKPVEKSNQHLGGIFTVNNGWDAPESKADLGNFKIPKLKRTITPPKIVNNRIEDKDVMEAHDEFMNGFSMPEFSFSSPHSQQKDPIEDEDFGQRKTEKVKRKSKSSVNSSEEESDSSDTASVKSRPKKISKLSYSDDEEENEPSENFKRANYDYDALEICADYGDLGDFDVEETPPNAPVVQSVVDDFKISGYVQRIVPPMDFEKEFAMNTEEITQHIVNPETDNILKTYYGNACPAFLDNRCSMPKCRRSHVLISENVVLKSLALASSSVIQSVFQVALRFHRLFQTYISVFVEICVNNKDDKGLSELVKACDRYPRTITCYKDIVQKLIAMDYMKHHKAISFIIENHTDSEIARDVIISLIIDSGPFIVYFMDYIENVHIQKPLRIDIFNRILHTCVSFQNPKLPNFCLNYLQECPTAQFDRLNSDHLRTFLMMNKILSQMNDYREEKSLIVTQKLLQSGKW